MLTGAAGWMVGWWAAAGLGWRPAADGRRETGWGAGCLAWSEGGPVTIWQDFQGPAAENPHIMFTELLMSTRLD